MKSTSWRAIGVLAVLALFAVSASKVAESKNIDDVDDRAGERGGEATAASRTSVTTDSYTVKVSVPASVAAGAKGQVRVTLAAKPGWKLNQEFPTKLVVSAPADVTLEKAKLRAKDATSFTKQQGVFDVVFTPSATGGKDFSAKLRFAVCTDATCDPKTENLSWQISVK